MALVKENAHAEWGATVNFKGNCISHLFMPIFTGATTITAAGTLVKNTLNFMNDNSSSVYALPAAATSTKGDIVVVKYIAIMGAGTTHQFDTDAARFSTHSTVFLDGGTPDGNVYLYCAVPGSDHDVLTLTGTSNAGCGIGTTLTFYFDGTYWAVDGDVKSSGDGTGPAVAAFS